MLKKISVLIFSIILMLFMASCGSRYVQTDDEIRQVIQEELSWDAELQIVDSIHRKDTLLVIYSYGSEYGIAEFEEKDSRYRLRFTSMMYDRGTDLRSAPLSLDYLFVINNENCTSLQIIENGAEHLIEVTDLPFVYVHEHYGDFEYNFLDRNGNLLDS
ncbi:hypothetical protein [Proteiniclasticum sp.]|uniref:hypothetical protein n=1 Tax=Proteiniclasticum sp. TaxID=2053595 RepID=UPI00289F5FA1|nr:hypothetical protein [Proteiniclasticum sp.]